ncbi:MAG: YkgJ family cysteine cluster protein [Bacteroidota bacterium]|jgi:Fe-S-cluster containining protein
MILTSLIAQTLIFYHHPDQIQSLAKLNAEENIKFEKILLETDCEALDQIVFKLQDTANKTIDCTQCGNCCKSFMINVEDDEADKVCKALDITREEFDEKYIEKGTNGMMIINTIPCTFLKENKCSIYENRFSGCREFPALHLPDIQKRLFTIFHNYERCPIIFTVIEELKSRLHFKDK